MNYPSRVVTLILMLTLSVAGHAYGLSTEQVGPTKGDRIHPQAGWPHGLVDILKHGARVYSHETNGNERVYFNADAQQLTELLQLYSKIRLRDHVVQLKTGVPTAKSFNDTEYTYNVRLDVLGGIVLGMKRIEGQEAVTYEPVLTVYVEGKEEQELLEQLEWPENLIIKHEIDGSTLKSKLQTPARKLWHTAVDFEDGKPAVDFESGVQTTVTLWEKDHPHGFDLGKVTYQGKFSIAFSDRELERLEKSELWMTMTVGNWLTKARPNHPRLDIESFDLDPDAAQTVTVFKPQLYHGRILFQDGSPPILDPEPWPGAEIQVSFPYAGQTRPDKEGYFKLSLTKDQLKDLKQRRESKNIYVPSYKSKNQSTALHVFPAEKLTTDKDKAGVVKIPRPEPPNLDF